MPPPEVINLLRKSFPGSQFQYSDIQYQPLKSTSCGYYCIYFIKKFLDGESNYDIMYDNGLCHTECPYNDKRVRKETPI